MSSNNYVINVRNLWARRESQLKVLKIESDVLKRYCSLRSIISAETLSALIPS